VTVAVWLIVRAPVVAWKATALAAAATVTEAGTVRAAALLDSATTAPPDGAGWVSVTVQALLPLDPRLVGVQTREEIRTAASTLMVAVPVAPA
jgi:hypothetical protein